MPRVYIIILNWNGCQDTIECIESLKKINYQDYKIVVVDNGSTDASIEIIPKKYFQDINFIEIKKNLGYAGGNNVGIRYALEKGADYVLLLNNDTLVSPDFLSKLVAISESSEKIGMAGPKILFANDKNRIWFGGGVFTWFGGDKHFRYNEIDANDSQKDIDYMTGCALLIKKEVIEKIGLLNEDYFLYYEDIDWCLRAKKIGHKIVYEPSSKIWHKVSRTAKPAWDKIIFYYHARNALLLAKLNAPKIILAAVYFKSLLRYFKQIIKLVFFPSKRVISKMIMLGISDFYRGRFGVYKNSNPYNQNEKNRH
ncbi:MAG: hypothetical protein A2174_02690 [Candidatus Portnoybacteria bacterium RBG_13_41_18]|uniref:Glycosyltransferase 2-like domain-containing protein n=1 Tax=Candidatus Portnoybacteria bacterium RBG_13_41_18 TaxID=1801991 RepID=A0A1G2F8U9_9BACT|nr:MAG: hypothetical protein A2174_02690 [Candidatus Portnoybacteria bacterium RBG_13_41_18]